LSILIFVVEIVLYPRSSYINKEREERYKNLLKKAKVERSKEEQYFIDSTEFWLQAQKIRYISLMVGMLLLIGAVLFFKNR